MSHLRDLRLSKGLSLRKLADKSGISHQQIKNIEDGINSPSMVNLMKIYKALEVENLLSKGVLDAGKQD